MLKKPPKLQNVQVGLCPVWSRVESSGLNWDLGQRGWLRFGAVLGLTWVQAAADRVFAYSSRPTYQIVIGGMGTPYQCMDVL